jgi:hypothetical protein
MYGGSKSVVWTGVMLSVVFVQVEDAQMLKI